YAEAGRDALGDVYIQQRPFWKSVAECTLRHLFGDPDRLGKICAVIRRQAEGKAGDAENGGLQGARDRAGVCRVVAEICSVVYSRAANGRPYLWRQDLVQGERYTVGRSPIHRPMPVIYLPDSQRTRQRQAVR